MPASLTKHFTGPFLVGFAAFLWATDALVRYPTSGRVDPTFIVLVEHIVAVLILLPWLLMKHKKAFFALNAKEWMAAVFSGMGGSAIGTLFFTASFLYVNPSVSVLLQKLQPIMVVFIAYLFLGERPLRKFYFWSIIALAAGIILSFPDLNFDFLSGGVSLHSKGIQYSLGAALLWAASTVSGKILLKRIHPTVATFWRFFFGFFALAVVQSLTHESLHWNSISEAPVLLSLFYLSLIPGLFAMLAYYSGLARTSASVTTFIELLYPIGAVALNTLFLHTPLGMVQTIAGGILIIAVAMISL
jgi:drug/metabolite transporter (DMT)-like permease